MFNLSLNCATKKLFKNGFVKLIDCMPRSIPKDCTPDLMCDSAIVQAARVSYGQGLKDYDTDKKLINYLYKHKHTSPFEMVKFKFHIKAPIFVARQWFRHRMGNYNEISGRYSELKEEIYEPLKVSSQSKINKQLSANDDLLNNDNIKFLMQKANKYNKEQFKNYQLLIKNGVSRETARINLPLSLFTEFYFSIDLHNLLNFLKLRNSKNAQYEIKEYATAIEELIQPLCPITFEAYHNHKTITLSKNQIKCLELEKSIFNDLNKREQNEILDFLRN